MFKSIGSSLVLALLLVGACQQAPIPDIIGPFEARLNPQLAPLTATVPDGKGGDYVVATSRDAKGVQSDFIEGEVLLRPTSDADVQAFLNHYGGTVIGDDSIPEPPAEWGITLTPEQRRPTQVAIRINLAALDASAISANATAAGHSGVTEFSSEAGLMTFAAIFDAIAAGFDAIPDYVHQPNQVFPVTLMNTQERPIAGGFTDALTATRPGGAFPVFGTQGSQTNVTLAWQFVAAHGIQRRVQVAIIDNGFYLNSNGTPLGSDSDFPASPRQIDLTDGDNFANGPNPNACATTPCFWHGTGCAGVAMGIMNNSLGVAGTGALVGDPILIRSNGNALQHDQAVRTAIALGADVISMSWGSACNGDCLDFYRNHTPFEDAVKSGSRTVFVAAAGNGAGTPAAGYDVDAGGYRPGILGHVICVGALNDDATTITSYSNFGSSVDVFAPTNIPVMSYPPSTGVDAAENTIPLPISAALGVATTQTFGGTSASTPFVAGVAAMMKAVNPNLSSDEVSKILRDTAKPGGDAFVTRVIDAYAAVRRAAQGFPDVPDFLEPNNGPGAPSNLGNSLSYGVSNLTLNSQDRDFFTFQSPFASRMTITLTYPAGLGNISVSSLLSLGDNTCGAPTLQNNAVGSNGRVVGYNVPAGPLVLGLRADDINAYNMTINFTSLDLVPSGLPPDSYEPNNDVATARYIHSYAPGTGGFGAEFVIDPSVTIKANLHNTADVDYYIVRGARLSDPQAALLFGAPFLSLYANTSSITMEVYQRNDDGTQGPLILGSFASSCVSDLKVLLQSDVYYLVKIFGSPGEYTLFNGAVADPAQLPPILQGGFPDEIIKPGPVEIDKELRSPLFFLFVADPAFDAISSINENAHLNLLDLNGAMIGEGVASGQGERLSLANTIAHQGYAIKATPTDFSAGPPRLRLAWQPSTPIRVSGNLILNPGAEINGNVNAVPLWTIVSGSPRIIAYGDAGQPSATGPGPANRGLYLFSGGPNNTSGLIQQYILFDASWVDAINAGRVNYKFSAFFGGALNDSSSISARLLFRDASDSLIAWVDPPTISSLERGNQTGLQPIEVSGQLPPGTAPGQILLNLGFVGENGIYNYACADNIELVLLEYAQ